MRNQLNFCHECPFFEKSDERNRTVVLTPHFLDLGRSRDNLRVRLHARKRLQNLYALMQTQDTICHSVLTRSGTITHGTCMDELQVGHVRVTLQGFFFPVSPWHQSQKSRSVRSLAIAGMSALALDM